MRLIDADALLKKTINNPLHAPYIVEKDIREMPTIQPVATDTNVGDKISRQTAIDMLCSKCTVDKPETCSTIQKGDNWCEEVYMLQRMPSAQPDRMRGRWTPHREKSREYIGATLIYVTYDYWFCDNCGYRVEDGQPLYNFCPNCGADMEGDIV